MKDTSTNERNTLQIFTFIIVGHWCLTDMTPTPFDLLVPGTAERCSDAVYSLESADRT